MNKIITRVNAKTSRSGHPRPSHNYKIAVLFSYNEYQISTAKNKIEQDNLKGALFVGTYY